MAGTNRQQDRWIEWLILGNFVALFAVTLWLRLYHLGSLPGFNGDEAWHALQAKNFLSGGEVNWMLATGRVANPFYFLLSLPFQLTLPPTLLVARIPAVLSGILLVVLTYYLLQKVWPKQRALLAALIVSCLPVNIAFSRIGIEASQIALGGLFVLYFLLKRNGWLLFSGAAALLIHPVNLFLAPMVLTYLIVQLWTNPNYTEDDKYRIGLRVLGVTALLIVAVVWHIPKRYTDPNLIWASLSWKSFLPFILNYLRVVSGINVYYEFSENLAVLPLSLIDGFVWLAFVCTFGYGLAHLIRNKCWEELAWVGGFLLSLITLWILGGVPTVKQVQRYSLFTIVPLATVMALLLQKMAVTKTYFRGVAAATLVFCWMLTLSFGRYYFGPLQNDGGGGFNKFPAIVAVGPRAALPHATPTTRRLGESDFVLVDWGATGRHYVSDLTRVLVTGRILPKLARVHRVVLRAQRAAIRAIRPGALMCDVDAIARSVIAKAGYNRYFGHGLGHGIGLQIHEEPYLAVTKKRPLKAGMVVTVEPGIYVPGWGGVRLEDDVLVTRGGHEVLSSISKELSDCVVG